MPNISVKQLFEKSELTSAVGYMLSPASGWTVDLSKPKGVKGSDLKKADKPLFVALAKELEELDRRVNAHGDAVPDLRDKLIALPPVWPSTTITMDYLRTAKEGLDYFMPGPTPRQPARSTQSKRPEPVSASVPFLVPVAPPAAPVEKPPRKPQGRRPADRILDVMEKLAPVPSSPPVPPPEPSVFDRLRKKCEYDPDRNSTGFSPAVLKTTKSGRELWQALSNLVVSYGRVFDRHQGSLAPQARRAFKPAFNPHIGDRLPFVSIAKLDAFEAFVRHADKTPGLQPAQPAMAGGRAPAPTGTLAEKPADLKNIDTAWLKNLRAVSGLGDQAASRAVAGLQAIYEATNDLRKNIGPLPPARVGEITSAMAAVTAAVMTNQDLPEMPAFLQGGAAQSPATRAQMEEALKRVTGERATFQAQKPALTSAQIRKIKPR